MVSGQTNLINDVGVLLKLPTKVLNELVAKANICIGSIIADAKDNQDQTVIINIGIGTLSVNLVDMQCKFVPSKELKTAIREGLTAKKDPLELALEQTLAEKLIGICEEVA